MIKSSAQTAKLSVCWKANWLYQQQKAGDKVTLKIEREEKEKRVTLTLKQFPDEPDRAGIGVSLYTDRNVKVEPDIDFEIENIGGPSAGLMMSLEIYNQLTKPDETKGYDIAGTGTIDVDGKVGPCAYK